MKRASFSTATKTQVLHEGGYKCANPACRTILTLDIHHLEYVSQGGSDSAENLLALCPNCHALHHRGHIPCESLRAWKMLLLSLNEGFPRQTMDLLLGLAKLDAKVKNLVVSGEGVLQCAGLIASDLVVVVMLHAMPGEELYAHEERYLLRLSDKGRSLIEAWKRGRQEDIVKPDEHV
jgi:hypothetical protein